MTATLDVALGLVFVFLALSLLASAIAEALEHYFRYRSDYLRRGIQALLFDGNASMTQAFYDHSLIKSLETPLRFLAVKRGKGPSYIPSRQFVLALLDIASGGAPAPVAAPVPPPPAAGAAGGGGAMPAAPNANASTELMAAVERRARSGDVPRELASLMRVLANDAGGDLEKFKTSLQQTFDASMDRVAGWYKRHAQFLLLSVGALVALVVNADALRIVHTLSNDQAVRAALVAAAESYARESGASRNGADTNGQAGGSAPPPTAGSAGADAPGAQAGQSPGSQREPGLPDIKREVDAAVVQLSALGLPVGWRYYDQALDDDALDRLARDSRIAGDREQKRRRYLVEQRVLPRWSGATPTDWARDWWDQFASHLLGWLFTAFAISFGAPFWFDTLNKIMVIRSTVKPREKSGDEGSEDRRR